MATACVMRECVRACVHACTSMRSLNGVVPSVPGACECLESAASSIYACVSVRAPRARVCVRACVSAMQCSAVKHSALQCSASTRQCRAVPCRAVPCRAVPCGAVPCRACWCACVCPSLCTCVTDQRAHIGTTIAMELCTGDGGFRALSRECCRAFADTGNHWCRAMRPTSRACMCVCMRASVHASVCACVRA